MNLRQDQRRRVLRISMMTLGLIAVLFGGFVTYLAVSEYLEIRDPTLSPLPTMPIFRPWRIWGPVTLIAGLIIFLAGRTIRSDR